MIAKLLDKVKDNLIIKETRIEDSMQQSFKAPYPRPANREQFWADFSYKPFDYVARKYGNYGFVNNLRTFCRNIKKRIVK